MYTHFIYKDGSNPYISMTNDNLFRMICKYHLIQFENDAFFVMSPREWNGAKTYADKRDVLRAFAQEWQSRTADFAYDYRTFAGFGSFFEEYGKKYGLLREFRENGII